MNFEVERDGRRLGWNVRREKRRSSHYYNNNKNTWMMTTRLLFWQEKGKKLLMVIGDEAEAKAEAKNWEKKEENCEKYPMNEGPFWLKINSRTENFRKQQRILWALCSDDENYYEVLLRRTTERRKNHNLCWNQVAKWRSSEKRSENARKTHSKFEKTNWKEALQVFCSGERRATLGSSEENCQFEREN